LDTHISANVLKAPPSQWFADANEGGSRINPRTVSDCLIIGDQ